MNGKDRKRIWKKEGYVFIFRAYKTSNLGTEQYEKNQSIDSG